MDEFIWMNIFDGLFKTGVCFEVCQIGLMRGSKLEPFVLAFLICHLNHYASAIFTQFNLKLVVLQCEVFNT